MKSMESESTMATRTVPRFRNEKEEAAWWDKNRVSLDKDFLEAAKAGRMTRFGRVKLEARVAGTATKMRRTSGTSGAREFLPR